MIEKKIFIEFTTVDEERYGYQYVKVKTIGLSLGTLEGLLSEEIARQIDAEILNTLMITADKIGTNQIALSVNYRPALQPKFIDIDFKI